MPSKYNREPPTSALAGIGVIKQPKAKASSEKIGPSVKAGSTSVSVKKIDNGFIVTERVGRRVERQTFSSKRPTVTVKR